jgi:sulfur carrier protein
MTITVNEQPWELPHGTTLADVLARLNVPPRGVAVALNGTVVPRVSWPGTPLSHGARIDVVTAVQGG